MINSFRENINMSESYDTKQLLKICVKVYLKSEMSGTLEENLEWIVNESYIASRLIYYFCFRASK